MAAFGGSLQVNSTPNRRFMYSHKSDGAPYATLFSYPIFKRSSDDLYPNNLQSSLGFTTQQPGKSRENVSDVNIFKGSSQGKDRITSPFHNVLGSNKYQTSSNFDDNKARFYAVTPASPFKSAAKSIIN
ncbi:hypothetical protein SteCoe_15081 [Stentor coeruleus]|uniref:Uncharacterized protein n=1 Tax=Stentor coeruleus TaxID=5963 RepID=A0A1R2C4M1_9CILI|nr:hypothetical protein SteCoe_15081 [Stentor coeruleus]